MDWTWTKMLMECQIGGTKTKAMTASSMFTTLKWVEATIFLFVDGLPATSLKDLFAVIHTLSHTRCHSMASMHNSAPPTQHAPTPTLTKGQQLADHLATGVVLRVHRVDVITTTSVATAILIQV